MRWKLIVGVMLLMMSLVMSATAEEKGGTKSNKKAGISTADKAQKLLCKRVASMIKAETIEKYSPESIDISPHASEYRNLDIDGDGRIDRVTVDSGSEGSYLMVNLSSGGEYDLERNGFIILIKLKGEVYALVTYWEWDRQPDGSKVGKKVANRLYKLTKHEAKLVCDINDLKRR